MTGKYYYGQHTTDNLDDGYKGSGGALKKYYKEHPHDFIKEILSFHDSYEELNQAEYDIIHDALNDPMCLNIREGGFRNDEETCRRISKSNKGYKPKEATRKKLSDGNKAFSMWCVENNRPYRNTKSTYVRTPEYRKKLSDSLKQWNKDNPRPKKPKVDKRKFKTDEERSAFFSQKRTESNTGRMWMNDGKNEAFVTREVVSEYISNGYVIGRIYRSTGVKYSEESKAKMSQKKKGLYLGVKWMHDDNGNTTFAYPDRVQEYLDKGWKLGRK